MQAPQTLRRPANWQDFETLCLKLWGEIWNCHEIKKNGRIGQAQHGVDVYGIPSFDTAYYGIQCKGKDEYTHSQFTKKEIDDEVEKAKKFKPQLKKLYFATTAVKDAIIEEYVREKNLEHKAAGLFEVHLYSWEDIVDKIDENKQTHDWYVNNQNYKSTQAVEVTFGDNTKEVTLKPEFKRDRIDYIKKTEEVEILSESIAKGLRGFESLNATITTRPYYSTTVNKSYVEFFLRIHNTGKAPIEDYKLFVQFKGNIQHIDDTNEKGGMLAINPIIRKQYTTFLNEEDFSAKIVPIKSLLVSEDTFASDDIFLKPHPEETRIEVLWKLISRDYKSEGVIIINLEPKISTSGRKFITVDDINEERTDYGEYKDVTVIKDDKD